MARRTPGLYFDQKTGTVNIDKRIPGVGRVRRVCKASSLQDAERVYREVVNEAITARKLETLKTFRAAATKYLKEETKRSLARDADCLVRMDPYLGGLSLEQVHQSTIQPYIEARRKAGIKSATVARELAVARRILTLASRVWRDECDKPWLVQAPLIRLPDWDDHAKPYPLTWEEQRRLISELPAHLAEMALFAVNTGAREHIVCVLRWEWEIVVRELGTSVFAVPGRHTKNQDDALIVLNSIAKSVVDNRRNRGEETVFGYEEKPVTRMHNTAWKRAWKAAGLPVGQEVLSGPHNLRHTFARRLRQVGVPLETRKALMHHTDGDITIHYSPAELRELIDAVERIVQSKPMTMLRAVGK